MAAAMTVPGRGRPDPYRARMLPGRGQLRGSDPPAWRRCRAGSAAAPACAAGRDADCQCLYARNMDVVLSHIWIAFRNTDILREDTLLNFLDSLLAKIRKCVIRKS